MNIRRGFLLVAFLAGMVSPMFAEKIAAYLLQMSTSSNGDWVVTNTYNQSVNFLLTTQDGDKYWGVAAPGGSNETTINSGKYYHIYPCSFPGYAVDSDTGRAPTFDTQNWDCSK